MDNKKKANDELRQELMRVVNKIKLSDDKFPADVGLLKVLLEIENEMSNSTPDKKKLEKGTFGIFRLITESYSFEKSLLGQEVLNLHKRIKQFVKDFC